jgi:hypothetical protein
MEASPGSGYIHIQQDADELKNLTPSNIAKKYSGYLIVETYSETLTVVSTVRPLIIQNCKEVIVKAGQKDSPDTSYNVHIAGIKGDEQRTIIIEDENCLVSNLAHNVTIIVKCKECTIEDYAPEKAIVFYNGNKAQPTKEIKRKHGTTIYRYRFTKD